MADNPPSEKVFIGDVPVGADEDMLHKVFSVYGAVADVKVLPPRTAGTKGAALVRFEALDTAQWLVENVNGNIPQGMSEPVYVTFAKTGKSWGGGDKSWGGGDNGGWGKAAAPGAFNASSGPYDGGAKASNYSAASPPASEKLFIGDVPVGMDEETFSQIMSKYGTVVDVKMLPARALGEKGSALLRFSTVDEAQWVVENINGNIPEGMTEALYICFARNSGRGGGSSASNAAVSALNLGPFAAALQTAARGLAAGKGASKGVAAATVKGGGGSKGRSWGPSGNDITEVVRGILRSGSLPGSGKKPDSNTVQVTNLPSNTVDLDLYKLFAPFGAVAVNGVKAMLNEDGSCRGIGFVDYVDTASAVAAIETLNGTILPDGSELGVQIRPPSRPKYNGS